MIINKEDGQNRWLVEAYLDDDYEPMFVSLQRRPEFQLQVTITHTSNDPANMLVAVRSITKMNGHISVLMEGLMIPRRTHLAEVVLAGLVKKGLQGEALLQEFRQQMHERIDAKRRRNGKGKRLESALSSLFVCLPAGKWIILLETPGHQPEPGGR
ncbi:YwpF-like family protein [Geobacillus sp. WSUCF1]|uniref:YwpF-like family protein n=1 Tax=Geobacillus sp. WSUCF1 TaxID=886559 RepID=UPI00040DB322|nr:YwpF-like family protein [Geobacillus sp. WSUCF1]